MLQKKISKCAISSSRCVKTKKKNKKMRSGHSGSKELTLFD